jgi:hypothetical protein
MPMTRWTAALSVVILVALATLTSGATLRLGWLGWPLGEVPGWLPPVAGWLSGAWLGWLIYRRATQAPYIGPSAASAPTRATGAPPAAPTWRARLLSPAAGRMALAAFGVTATLALAALTSGQALALKWATRPLGELPAFAVPLAAFGLGFAPAWLWAAIASRPTPPAPEPLPYPEPYGWTLAAVAALWAAAIGSASLGAFSFAQAAVVVLGGTAAIPFAAQALRRLAYGEVFQLESHWGGLGGGLGGWRLSPLMTAALLALAFGAMTLAAAAGLPGPAPSAVKAPPAGTGPAARAPGR